MYQYSICQSCYDSGVHPKHKKEENARTFEMRELGEQLMVNPNVGRLWLSALLLLFGSLALPFF